MSFRPLEEVWDEIVATLELGSGLRFVLVEAENDAARRTLRKRLEDHLGEAGRPLHAPAAGEDVLDWLSREQQAGGAPRDGEAAEVARLLSLPAGVDEKNILYRINEGRDNLRRNLGGVFFLVGGKNFLRRVANEAPDLWSVRENAIDLAAPAELPKLAAEKPSPAMPASTIHAYRYDVFLSYSHHDAAFAKRLRARLASDGVRPFSPEEDIGPDAVVDAAIRSALQNSRFFIPIVSPQYTLSPSAEYELSALTEQDPKALTTRVLPVMVRDAVPPAHLRNLQFLDWRTTAKMDETYPKLLRVLQGGTEDMPVMVVPPASTDAALLRDAKVRGGVPKTVRLGALIFLTLITAISLSSDSSRGIGIVFAGFLLIFALEWYTRIRP